MNYIWGENTLLFLLWFFTLQATYGFLILLTGRLMMDYFEWAVYEKPDTTYQKVVNFIMYFMIGSGPYIYSRLEKYNWFLRKLLMVLALIAQIIISVLIYEIFNWVI